MMILTFIITLKRIKLFYNNILNILSTYNIYYFYIYKFYIILREILV